MENTTTHRWLSLTGLLWCAAALMASSQACAQASVVRSAIEANERMNQAILVADTETLRRYISEDFVAMDPSNTIRRRDALIAAVDSGQLKYTSYDMQLDFAEDLGGGLVVLMGIESTEQAAVPADGAIAATALDRKLHRRFTNVFRQEGDVWRLVIKQSTIVSTDVSTDVSADPSTN